MISLFVTCLCRFQRISEFCFSKFEINAIYRIGITYVLVVLAHLGAIKDCNESSSKNSDIKTPLLSKNE